MKSLLLPGPLSRRAVQKAMHNGKSKNTVMLVCTLMRNPAVAASILRKPLVHQGSKGSIRTVIAGDVSVGEPDSREETVMDVSAKDQRALELEPTCYCVRLSKQLVNVQNNSLKIVMQPIYHFHENMDQMHVE